MDADTERDPEDEWGLDQYWRRRAIALGGALAVVGLAAWGCGVFGGGGDGGKQNVQSMAGVASAVPTTPAATPAPTVTVTASPSTTASPSASASASPGASAKAAPKAGDACDPRDVVVDFAANGETFAGSARPSFRLTVVNTGQRACTYDVGTHSLDVRITSGSDRVWAASTCDSGSGSNVQTLRRGIPYATTLVWDRRRAGSDCQGSRAKALPGTYVASVKGDHVKAEKQVFRLR
ncbi:hypothetical protein [Actinomadura rupiterrae]|uniref:hypothetical protein n=1 Tax=Actinomadura rupiterrae TaxID=559627 RepID=UPI0020A3034E|nr:hypothetical protein [Actinomadura rupiterrae]MCP2342847.1 hypothetical protein [Actinomadura rupiterrae]